jgi:excisionase family DNA binding protein
MSEHLENTWLTAREAGFYLQVSPRTIVYWAKQGQLKGYRLSGTKRCTWRFLRADLDAKMTPPSAANDHGGINAAEE